MHAAGISTSLHFLVKTYLWGLQMCMGETTGPSRSPPKTHLGLVSIIFCKCTACLHTSPCTFHPADTHWHSSERVSHKIQRMRACSCAGEAPHRTAPYSCGKQKARASALEQVMVALWHKVGPIWRRFCYLLFLG